MSDAPIRDFIATWAPVVTEPFGATKIGEMIGGAAKRQAEALALLKVPVRDNTMTGAESYLLRADRSPVPFAGRDAEIIDFMGWFHSGETLRWRLVTGPSGRGKTRLLMEIVDQLAAEAGRPNRAGFLDLEAVLRDPSKLLGFTSVAGDLFIVVDYAERARDPVVALLLTSLLLAKQAKAGTGRRIRVVMLARGVADIWESLKREFPAIGEFMEARGLEHEPLNQLAASVEDRALEFERAYAAFDAYFVEHNKEEPRPFTALPDLSGLGDDDDNSEAVMIHLAALATRHDAMAAHEMTEDRLLDWIIDRERAELDKRIRQVPGAGALEGEPMLEAAGLVTLAVLGDRAVTLERATALLPFCPLIAGTPPALCRKIAEILEALYPGPDGIVGLAPDRIGTHLLGLLPPRYFADVLAKLSDQEATNGLTKLNWLTRGRRDEGTPRLNASFDAAPEKVLPLVVDVAQASGDPIGMVAAKWLENNPQVGLAKTITSARTLPYPTTVLREFSAAVAARLLAETPDDGSEEAQELRAKIATDLGVSLAGLEEDEEALEKLRLAVDAFRRLAGAKPDGFLPELAGSLTNMSIVLSKLERRDEALSAVQEGVGILRDLAKTRPDDFLPNLAGSLNGLSIRLAKFERHAEALSTIQEAVEINRDLANKKPNAFLPDLATSLITLSNRLTNQKRPKDALEVNEEVLTIFRRLTKAKPDAFNPNLALSLYNISFDLAQVGRLAEALHTIQEAVAIWRLLAAARPAVFNTDLADSLIRLSMILESLNRHDEARTAKTGADEITNHR
jgi:tetratricopeptide (TPR) repeat protein